MKIRKLISFIILTFILILFNSCSKNDNDSAINQIDSQVKLENDNNQKNDNNVKQEIDKAAQQILENDKFLKSQEGIEFQAGSWRLSKAYFDGDRKYIQNNMLNTTKDINCYSENKGFSKIEYMIFRFLDYDAENKSANAEYIIKMEKTDSFIYLDFKMKLDNGKWKIITYGLDA